MVYYLGVVLGEYESPDSTSQIRYVPLSDLTLNYPFWCPRDVPDSNKTGAKLTKNTYLKHLQNLVGTTFLNVPQS